MIWVVIGQTGSGKSTFLKEVVSQSDLNVIKTITTRPRREGEADDYLFLTNLEFYDLKEAGRLISVREYNTMIRNNPAVFKYGVDVDTLVDNSILITDWEGYLDLEEYLGSDKVFAVYMYTEPDDLLKQAMKRKDFDVTEFNRRVKQDVFLSIEKIESMLPYSNLLSLGGSTQERIDAFLSFKAERE